MRKQYKNKKRSCGLCKPWKRGWDCRWTKKDRNKMIEAHKEMKGDYNESETYQ